MSAPARALHLVINLPWLDYLDEAAKASRSALRSTPRFCSEGIGLSDEWAKRKFNGRAETDREFQQARAEMETDHAIEQVAVCLYYFHSKLFDPRKQRDSARLPGEIRTSFYWGPSRTWVDPPVITQGACLAAAWHVGARDRPMAKSSSGRLLSFPRYLGSGAR